MTTYAERGYGARQVGFGEKPGIVVVDFQLAFTDPGFATGGAPLVRRAVENTARLLQVARAAGVPVASCFMCYHSERDAPHRRSPIHRTITCCARAPRRSSSTRRLLRSSPRTASTL